ncbi:MAG: FHA domain-containing protein [Myxococcota bacterium]
MGILTKEAEVYALASRNLVGRGPECSLVLDDRAVSTTHAILTWKSGRWLVRDLASRHGTLVDGERIVPGTPVPLNEGSTLRFSEVGPELVLLHAGPPGPSAHCGGRWVHGSDGVLALPDELEPECWVLADPAWRVERDDGAGQEVGDGQELVSGPDRWTLVLPAVLPVGDLPTTWGLDGGATLDATRLVLAPSRDEEHVEVTLQLPHGSTALSSRVHHFCLLLLARARLDDRAAGIDEAECGWRYVDDVCADLRIPSSALSLHMLRARRQLGEAGVADAAGLFERRRLSGQLRLGIANVEILQA